MLAACTYATSMPLLVSTKIMVKAAVYKVVV